MSDKKIGVGFGVMILNAEGEVLLGRRHEDPGSGMWTWCRGQALTENVPTFVTRRHGPG